MSYISLYRKFRPLKFSDMVGQDHISQILKNQIINDRIGHAYLFSGIRGTGKTTTAKIFARAVNCLNPIDGEPCNECEVCKAILNDTLTDVTEIDAASNNGVDNIRNIREEVMYLPTKAKYRVYIIDEVHMLSSGAFNALLKTLEEPPKHVKFILATTEPNKLPATILSRCQRFDFKRIPNEDIVLRLKEILSRIGKTADENALTMIAELSEGAMRDAISILERCVTETENISLEYVRQLVGMPENIEILQAVENIVDNKPEKILETLNKLLNDGRNITIILGELINKCQDVLIYKSANKLEAYSETEVNKVKEIADKVSIDKLVNLIADMSRTLNSIKWASNQIVVAQSQLIRMCISTQNDGLEDLRKRVERLESGIAVSKVEKVLEVEKQDKPIEENIMQKKEIKEEPKDETIVEEKKVEVSAITNEVTMNQDVPNWKDVLDELRQSGKVNLYANLITAEAKIIAEGVIGIYFKVDFAKTMTERPENIAILKEHIFKVLNTEYEIRCYVYNGEKVKSKLEEMEDTAKQFNIPMDIVDE